MPDREKIIKAYEDYVNSYIPVTTYGDYVFEMHKAVLALLKEQEAVKPIWSQGKPFCGACGLRIRGGEFCSKCGKPIAWEGR